MKIIADIKKCCGHARCANVDETLFVLDDNGYIAVSEIIVPLGQETLGRRGARACPERALTIVEDEAPKPGG